MRHGPMRDWLASLPDDDLLSLVEVVPALRRASNGSDDLRARIREFTDQQVEGLARAFLAGVAQRLRTDGFSQDEIDAPGPEDLRAMLLDHLPTAHGRLALHALLIGDGPASSMARTHATRLLTALDEELPITTTHQSPAQETTLSDVNELLDRLRHETTTLPPALRTAADAVAAGTLRVDAGAPALPSTAASLAHFAAEMAELATQLVALLGDEPVPTDLDGVQAHLDRIAEEERVAAERALVREHRDGISATIATLEADGGPAFLVESYRSMLEKIARELAAEPPAVPAARTPASAVTLPQTATEARALLAGIGVDDGLLAVLRPWPELCDAGEFIARDDVSAVVATEPAQVPELLARLDRLGVLRENDRGELALDEVTLRCLTLLPVEEPVAAGR